MSFKKQTKAILSFQAFYRGLGYGGWQGTTAVGILKTATLIYDRLFIAAPKAQVDHAINHISKEFRLNRKYLSDCWGSIDEIGAFLNSSQLLASMHEILNSLGFLRDLESIESQYGKYWYNGLFYTGQFHILSATTLPLWLQVRKKFHAIAAIDVPDALFLDKYPEVQANFGFDKKQIDWSELNSIGIPSPGNLPWSGIISARKSGTGKGLQELLEGSINENIASKILSELWKIFLHQNEDTKEMMAKAILSNVPLPIPVNPFSLYYSVQQIGERLLREKQAPWMTTFANLKKECCKAPELPLQTNAWGWGGRIDEQLPPPPLEGVD